MQSAAGSRPVQLLPIDIHYDKLLDWLIDRRHCTVKWPEAQQQIRNKIEAAVKDMPDEDEMARLVRSSSLNYFHCKRIVELLKVSEAGTKNIFGMYSSKRMSDWTDIVSCYNDKKVYLAECAQTLIRTVNFEVPAFKQQIKRAQQQLRDCERKQSEYTGTAAQHQQRYTQECRKMNIEGENIKLELLHQVKDLPQIYQKLCVGVESLAEPLEYYQEVVDFLLSQQAQGGQFPAVEMCPLLRHILRNGNTTVYQWKTGQVPQVVEEDDWLSRRLAELSSAATGSAPTASEDTGIDFGTAAAAPVGAEGEGGIDFGEGFSMDAIDFSAGAAEQTDLADIDFGDLVLDDSTGALAAGADTATDDVAEINFDIVIEETGAASEEGVHTAKGEDALTVLACPWTRDLFVNELKELEAFLLQRHAELSKNATDILSVTMLQSAPFFMQVQTEETVGRMLAEVQRLLLLWHDERTQHLIKICSSPRALDRLADSLRRILQLADKMRQKASSMESRQKELAQLQRDTEPKLLSAIAHAKDLQGKIQEEISLLYKNRKVNIMGEINNL